MTLRWIFICFFFSQLGFAKTRLPSATDQKTLERVIQNQIKASGISLDEVSLWITEGQKTIYSHQSEKSRIPASLSKIATAGAVLSKISANKKFETVIAAEASAGVEKNGTVKDGILKGALYLIGGGDPSFVSENAWVLVNELTRSGLKTVEGDLIVNDARFDNVRFDQDREDVRVDRAYDAPVGAMSFNWNSVTAWVRPGLASSAAHVVLDVLSPFLKLDNQTKTGTATSVAVERVAQVSQEAPFEKITVSGKVSTEAPEKAYYKNIREPALWSAYSIREFLNQRGITVKGQIKDSKEKPEALKARLKVLAKVESKPIGQIVADMLKFSNNYVAEMLTKNLSAEAGESPATMGGGLKVVREYLEKSAGLKSGEYEFVNPSGFTRANKMSVHQLGNVLNSILNDFRIAPEFLTALPIGLVDGTLKNRFHGIDPKTAARVRAKTGLLNGVVGLAGFAGSESGTIRTFAFLFNGKPNKEEGARALFDRLAASLVELPEM